MRRKSIDKIRCVDCLSDQLSLGIIESDEDDVLKGKLNCANCGRTYTISNGIVALLPSPVSHVCQTSNRKKLNTDPQKDSLLLKMKENEYYSTHFSPGPDEEQDVFYGTGWSLRPPQRHTDMYNFYLNHIRDDIEYLIAGKTLLNIGCGAGQEAEFLARVCQANVIGLDIAHGSIEAAMRRSYIFNYSDLFDGAVGDMEQLPFKDNSIDVCMTHTSLHHATNSFKVIDEMARVSRDGFVISSESVYSISIRFALMLGLTEESEDEASGNRVWRISKKDFRARLNEMEFGDVLIKTHWLNTSSKIRWGKIWGISIRRAVTSFLESELLLRLQDMVLGRVGNSIFVRVRLQPK